MKPPVLFLDVDGVLNSEATTERFNGVVGIDPALVAIVARAVADSGAEVVLSSSWRHHRTLRVTVRRHIEFIDVTPTLGVGNRGDEIAAWLFLNPRDRYAIVDDDCDFLPEQRPHLFRTSFTTGITQATGDAIAAHLSGVLASGSTQQGENHP